MSTTYSHLSPLAHPLLHLFPSREGANYYWYHRSVENFENWAPCSYDNTSNVSLPVPPGWTLLKTIYLTEPGLPEGFTATPLAILLKKDGMLVILVRGTQTPYEWLVDVSFQYYKERIPGIPGRTHNGFTTVANTLFKGMQSVIKDEVINGRVFNVAIAGHSLGSGVSTILSFLVQVRSTKYAMPN